MKTEDGKTVILKSDGTWAVDTVAKKADTDKKVKDVTEAFLALRDDVNDAGKVLIGGYVGGALLIGIGALFVITSWPATVALTAAGLGVQAVCNITAASKLKRAGWRAQRKKE